MTIASKPGHIDILTMAGSSQAAESLLPNKHSHRNRAGVGVGMVLTTSSLAAQPAPLPWAKAIFLQCRRHDHTLQGSDGCTSCRTKGDYHPPITPEKKKKKNPKRKDMQIHLKISICSMVMRLVLSSYSHVGRRERWGPGCLKHWHWEFPADRGTAFPFQRHVVVTRTVLQHQQ